MQAIGYLRVSTAEQAARGAGLEAQRAAITAACQGKGWQLAQFYEDAGYSAKDLRRPGIQAALEALQHGDATAIVVAKLDRLSRSMLDFSTLMATAAKQSWAIVALDCDVDTSTPSGEVMANMLATFSQFERRLIGQRTRDALAVRRAAGVTLGGPPIIVGELADRIVNERSAGRTLWQIADGLNAEGVTPPRGTQWRPTSFRALLARSQGS